MDWAYWQRIGSKALGGVFGTGGGGGQQPVTVNIPPAPDYTLPLLALGGLGILMLAGPKPKRRRR